MVQLTPQLKEEVVELRNKFKSHNRTKEYSTHSSKVHSVDWNCDGRRLASGGFDKSVCIVGLSNDRLSKEVIKHCKERLNIRE